MNEFLVCENIDKVYNENGKKNSVLKSISLKFDKGSFTAVTGPSGAGKSTLLHILGALDRPTSGSVCFEGREIQLMGERALALFRSRRIGFIFQFYHLLPEFTVLENVLMPSFAAGLPSGASGERAMELLDSAGLSGRARQPSSELSGGEMQRAAICRALMNDPDLILADEPTGNLDSANSARIMEILGKLNQEDGRTLIIATHDMELAGKAGSVAVLSDGRLDGFEKSQKGD